MPDAEQPSTQPGVLVVEDDAELADTYAAFLQADYDVRIATTVAAARDQLDATVDVVLLDRRLPDGSGDDLLDAIRARSGEYRVAMVTAARPDFDLIDLSLDTYLAKPVSKDELRTAVNALLLLDFYTGLQVELSSKRLRRNVLEVEKTARELATSDAFAQLEAEIEALEAQINDLQTCFDTCDAHLALPQ